MTTVIDPVTRLAIAVLISVVAGTFTLAAVAIFRRQQETRYFHGVNRLLRNYGPILKKILSGAQSPENIGALRSLAVPDLELLLEPYFSRGRLRPYQVNALQKVCSELGLITLWRWRLAGERELIPLSVAHSGPVRLAQRLPRLNFLLRATSARNLGTLQHEASWPLLVKSLDDLHPDVRSVALRSLAQIQAPQSFGALIERLHMAVLQRIQSPSQEHLKAAMAGFELAHAHELIPSLRHPHREIRHLAAEVLREMVSRAAGNQHFTLTRENLSPGLSELLLTELTSDANPEVRGRAAEVIAYLDDERATPVLLSLTDDPKWFVRFCALRGLAKSRFLPHLSEIHRCLGDRQWQVREAAIQTLLSFGQEGASHLFHHFLVSNDKGCRRHIIEAIQRAGLAKSLLEHYAYGGNGLAKKVVEEIVGVGATACFAGMLKSSSPLLRQRFLGRLNSQLPPQRQNLKPPTLESDLGTSEVVPFVSAVAA